MIHEATERSAKLANQLPAFSRRQAVGVKILYMNGYLDHPLLPGERVILKPFSLEGLTRKVREELGQEIRES
jgi:hypothetical protein